MSKSAASDKRRTEARQALVVAQLDRKGREARQRLIAAHEKVESIDKMRDQARRHETAALVRSYAAGVPQAECARILGLSTGRVWQLLRDAGALDAAPADDADATPEVAPAEPATA